MKKILFFIILMPFIVLAQIPHDSASVYCPSLWSQTGYGFPEAEDFGLSIGDQFDFTNLASKNQELLSNDMILSLSFGRPIIVVVGSGSCPRFRELVGFLRDFPSGTATVIWVNVLEAHPIDTLCPYRENLGSGVFPGNEPYFAFNQIRQYGEFGARVEYVIGQLSLPNNWIYLVDETSSRVLTEVVSPAVLFVLDSRDGTIVYELGHPDSLGLTNALDVLSLTLSMYEAQPVLGYIAPNPITHNSQWTGDDNVQIIINNASGQYVGRLEDYELFASGYYIATIVDTQGVVVGRQKIVKK